MQTSAMHSLYEAAQLAPNNTQLYVSSYYYICVRICPQTSAMRRFTKRHSLLPTILRSSSGTPTSRY